MEVFHLLTAYWLFKRQSEKLIAQNLGGIEALEHILLLQSLYQDIVLRLCKIGDTRGDTWGLPQVAKYAKKHSPLRSLPTDIDNKIADYLKAIKEIKDDQRNRYMAHISKEKTKIFKPTADFRGAIPLAVQICDELHVEMVEYKIGSEWAGMEINLREKI